MSVTFDFSKLEDAIDRATRALEKLDSRLDTTDNSSAKLNRTISTVNVALGVLAGNVATSLLSSIGKTISQLTSLDTRFARTLTSISTTVTRVGRNIQNIGEAIQKSFGIGALFASPAFLGAEGFDALSKRVQAFGDLTEQQTKVVQSYAYELSQTYPIAADEAVKAISKLIQAGEDLNSVKLVLPGAADLATIAKVELPDAAQGLIIATKNFKQFTEDIPAGFQNSATAADIFTGAITHSTAELTDLFDSMRSVDPTANLFNLDLAQTTAILAEFADNGLRGALAGRQLSYLFRALASSKDTKIFASINEQLRGKGVNDFALSIRNADGSLRDLNQIIQDINHALDALNLTEDARVQIITDLTGGQSQLALAVLLANNGYQQMADRILNVNSASETAAQILDQLQGQVSLLGTRVSVFLTKALIPLIQKGLTPIVKVVSEVVKLFGSLPDTVYELTGNIILLTTTIATLSGGILVATGSVVIFEGALLRVAGGVIYLTTHLPILILDIGAFVASLAILLTTVALVGGAIVTAGIIFTSFRHVIENNIGGAGDSFDRLKKSVSGAFDLINPIIREAVRVFDLLFGDTEKRNINDLGANVSTFFDQVTTRFSQLKSTILQGGAFLQVFGDFLAAHAGDDAAAFRLEGELTRLSRLPLVRALFGNNINASGLHRIFNRIQAEFIELGSAVTSIFEGITGILFGDPEALSKVKKGVSQILAVITEVLKGATGLDFTSSIFSFNQGDITRGIQEFVRTVLNRLKTLILQNQDALVNIGTTLVRLLFSPTRILGFAEFVLNALGLTDAANVVHKINQAISDVISAALNLGFDILAGRPVRIDLGGFLARTFGSIDPKVVGNGIKDAIINALGAVPQLLQDAGATLNLPGLTDFGLSLQDSQAFTQITDGLANIASYPFAAATDMFNGINDWMTAINGGNFDAAIALFAGIAVVAASSGALTTLFALLKTAFLGFVLPAFGLLTVVSALKNIKDLLAGDVGGFLTKTLADIASTLLSFFGVDISRDTIIDRVSAAFQSLHDTLPALINEIGNQVGKALQGLVDTITLAFENIRASTDEALGVASTGFGSRFHKAENFLKTSGAANSPDTVFGLLSTGLDPTSAGALARQNVDVLIDAFKHVATKYGGVSDIPKELFGQIVSVLNDSGLLNQALESLDDEKIKKEFTDRIQGIVSETPQDFPVRSSEFLQGVLNQFQTTLSSPAIQGLISVSDKQKYFKNILDGMGITDPAEQGDVLRQLLQDPSAEFAKTTLQQVAGAFGGLTPIPVTLSVDVNISAASIDTSQLSDQINSVLPTTLGIEVSGTKRITIGPVARRISPRFGFGFSQAAPGRANGGPLSSFSAYGVHDTRRPELAHFTDGTSILFTGAASGSMVKIPGMASAPWASGLTNVISAVSDNSSNDSTQNDTYLNDLKELDDVAKQIMKIKEKMVGEETQAFEEEAALRRKAQQEELRAEAQYQHDRKNIIDDAHDTLLDAIRRGDGATALATVRNARKQLTEQKYQFDLDKNTRDVALQEQIFQNHQQRDEQLRNYQDQLNDLLDHQRDVQSEVDRYNKAQEQSAQSVADLATSAANAVGQTVLNTITGLGLLTGASYDFLAAAEAALHGIQAGPGQTVPIVPPSIGPIPVPPNLNHPIGAPWNPAILQRYRDPQGQWWIWTGNNWQPATAVPGLAGGGSMASNRAYRVHDTQRPEMMKLSDGTTMMLTGNLHGRVWPVSPMRQQPGYGPTTRTTILQINSLFGDLHTNASDPLEIVEMASEIIMPRVQDIVDQANAGNRTGSMLEIKPRR